MGLLFNRTPQEWLEEYQKRHAYWEYSSPVPGSDREDLHAKLASEKHSGRFFNTSLLTVDDDLLRDAAQDIIEHFLAWLGAGLDALTQRVAAVRQQDDAHGCLVA